ncbi:MAG: twitch domain-containing radical SAM protein [Candidatus Eremiobacteraeota bacterium]|nr:twitch domain-containing radical SAM protein [Candidatus Eremiobacteraeota bacterium]
MAKSASGLSLLLGGWIISKTACVIPWTNLIVRRDGSAHFCCDVFPELTVDGRIADLSRDSLDDVWNAEELVRVRAEMARGEQPAACGTCWKREAEGGVSRRLYINPIYRMMGGDLALDDVTREGAETGYRLDRKPDWFLLELGNLCNFKCRSCNARSSSRIGTDQVQRAWTGETSAQVKGGSWFENVDAIADMIASTGHEMLTLSLLGGEPFLIKETWRLLEALVARGVAGRTNVGLVTNGQQRAAQVEEFAPLFRRFNVSVSIDGYGVLNEYLRHGCRWPQLVENLAWLRTIPNVDVVIAPTLQNANVLDMPALLRFTDALDVPLGFNVLTEPPRLAPTNLPPPVRRIAARRLRAYLDAECKPGNRAIVQMYCDLLEEPGDAFDPVLFREFAEFTNDLDVSRGERLSDAAPELVALFRFAGVPWPEDRRHVPPARSSFDSATVLERMNRTVSPNDAIFAVVGAKEWYFGSAPLQLAEIDALLREHGHAGLAGSRAVADYASHYGRTTRALRAALPGAAVYACDIDPDAVRFCADELGALPVITGWRPDEDRLPADLDAITCISLLTHTTLDHWRRTLRAWHAMLRPGGVVAFTYLSEQRIEPWLTGAMAHYGTYPPEECAAVERAVRDEGFGFAAIPDAYGDESSYGIAFATADAVRRELAAAGLEVIAMPGDAGTRFAQDLALARRPDAPAAAAARPQPDVAVVALYDPCCYAPDAGEGDTLASTWARLITAEPATPLPTELGFCDPRVAEVRERQAALAREYGIDAFCYRYRWGSGGPVWDAPLRDLVASGRPAFGFCLMIDVEDGVTVGPEDARALFETISAVLADPRYVRVDGAPLVVVRDLASLANARGVSQAWRDAAAARGFALHLSALRSNAALAPRDMGFDSFVESPRDDVDPAAAAAASLSDPWPAYRYFRTVAARRAAEAENRDLYELELRAAIEASRGRSERLVFVDAWNDWVGGRYLEPDDRDGRAMLLATRRAAVGPASAHLLLRRLRDALGDADASVTGLLGELAQAVARREDTLDRVLAVAEATLGRASAAHAAPGEPRATAVRHAHLEEVAGVEGALFTRAPIPLREERLHLRGWAHVANCDPAAVDLFAALEAFDGGEERLFRIRTRVPRSDVLATFPDYPPSCGFDVELDVRGLAPGLHRLAIVQATADARYHDATAAVIASEGGPCSNA